MKEITYDVPSVSCNHCVNSISTIAREAGVQDVEVDLVTKKVFVSFDPAKVDEAALKAAIEEDGYDIKGETEGRVAASPVAGKKPLNLV